MPNFVQATKNRSDRADWARVGKQRADEVRRWLAQFRREQGWEPGMVWDPSVAKYVDGELARRDGWQR